MNGAPAIICPSPFFLTNGISVIATVSALAVFNMWFVPISVLGVLPYFVVRVLRGREFYLLKKAQAKRCGGWNTYGSFSITSRR